MGLAIGRLLGSPLRFPGGTFVRGMDPDLAQWLSTDVQDSMQYQPMEIRILLIKLKRGILFMGRPYLHDARTYIRIATVYTNALIY